MDRAASTHPGVQAQLDRLARLAPAGDALGLDRIAELLARLGNPEQRLPPVFHVAGTNGKGSTCAFLRAALEAAGHMAHVYTSPHLVRFNERIRIAGRLIEDEALAALLAEVLDAAGEMEVSFFEVTTAAAFLAFARAPADACVIEVGLGGRLDATNVIPAPLVCGIAQLGLDHQHFLGNTLEAIAAEKAGIAKPGAPLITLNYLPTISARVAQAAGRAGTHWLPRGEAWTAAEEGGRLLYKDATGSLDLPLPRMPGTHQVTNAGLAIAILRHQQALSVPTTALASAMTAATWPARLQRLGPGPLTNLLPQGTELWLDGGHNPAAARAVADHFTRTLQGRPFHMIFGLLANKDADGVLSAFAGLHAAIHCVPVPSHDHYSPEALATLARTHGHRATTAPDVSTALRAIADQQEPRAVTLILGSLYLAGEVLKANEQLPA